MINLCNNYDVTTWIKRLHAVDESLGIVVGPFAVAQYRLLILGLHPQSILSLYGEGGEEVKYWSAKIEGRGRIADPVQPPEQEIGLSRT
jgi:hypothetical protein